MGQPEQDGNQHVDEEPDHVEKAQHVDEQQPAQHVEEEPDMIVATIRQGGVSVSYTATSNVSPPISPTTSPSWPQPDIIESQTRSLPKTPSVSPKMVLSRVSSPSLPPLTQREAVHWSPNPNGSCQEASSWKSTTDAGIVKGKYPEACEYNDDQTKASLSGFRFENPKITDQRQPYQPLMMSPRELLAKVNSSSTAFSLMPPPTPSPMPPSTSRGEESGDSRRPSMSSGEESALQWSNCGFEYPAELESSVLEQPSLTFWELMEPQVANEDYEDPDGDITPTPSPIYSDIYDSYGHRVEVETPCWDPSADPLPWNHARHWHSELISMRTPVPKKVKCSHKIVSFLYP